MDWYWWVVGILYACGVLQSISLLEVSKGLVLKASGKTGQAQTHWAADVVCHALWPIGALWTFYNPK
jgi:hypothetical protein